jgi:hypothetical protein
MRRLLWICVTAAGLLLGGDVVSAAPETYADYEVLLKQYVKEDGLVDYAAWKEKDEPALRAVVARLESLDLRDATPNEVKAYWINVYNALTLQAVLEFFPLRSIREKAEGKDYNVWDHYLFSRDETKAARGARKYSLNQIEHEVLRPLGDPRIHAALNCASKGCPPLRAQAYVAARLDEQLEEQTRAWLNDPTRGVRVKEGGVVALSELFNWFGSDFGADLAARLRWVSKYLRDPAQREAVTRRGARIETLPWDWSLNQR